VILSLFIMSAEQTTSTLFDLLGGESALRQVVHRFYELMDEDPAFIGLRAIHGRDLEPMKGKLSDWLSGWLGGPPLYDARADATCIGHAHSPFKIDEQMRDEWLACMYRALDECAIPASVQGRLRPPMAALAEFLRNH
jgi:hemoglobin